MTRTKLRSDEPVIVRNRAVLGGRPMFRGTRVQAALLFENLAEGYSLDEILDNFPTLDRADVQRAILQAREMIGEAAPGISAPPRREASRARVPG